MALDYLTSEVSADVLDDIKNTLFSTVNNATKHNNYDRVVDVAKKCKAYSSGVGLDDYLVQFTPRETDEYFEQRVRITKHILPAIVQNLVFVLWKIYRSPAIHLAYTNTTAEKKEKLVKSDGQYFAKSTVQNYYTDKQVLFDTLDPNIWVVTEFESTDGTVLAATYPLIVSSEDALNFEYLNGLLNFLIVRSASTFIYVEDGDKKAWDDYTYTIYTPKQNVALLPYFNAGLLDSMENMDTKEVTVDDKAETIIKLNGKLYIVNVPDAHNIGWVEADRIGYKPDYATQGETFVPFWWNAEAWLSKIIKSNSEWDLTNCLHAFPQKVQYAPRCNNPECNGGKLISGKGLCPTCKGKGVMGHLTAQDTIELALPESKEEMIDLVQLINYVYPPVEGLKYQGETMFQLINFAKESIYNSDVYTKAGMENTLGAKEIDMQSIYDTIFPFARKYASMWKFTIETIAKITTTDEGLIITATVDRDFKFKTFTELMGDLQAAKNAGANENILKAIQDDIINVIYQEHPTEKQKRIVQEKFNVFSGKSELTATSIRASGILPLRKKVLYDNSGWIFEDIEVEHPDFYSLEFTKQEEIVNAKLDTIISEYNASQAQRLSFAPQKQTANDTTE